MIHKSILPVRSLYAYGVFVIGVALIAFLSFVFQYAYSYVAAIGYKTGVDLGTNTAETDAVSLFFNNVSIYITIFMLIVLGFWAIVYTQKKGRQIYV